MPDSFSVIVADDEEAIHNGLISAVPWDAYRARVVGSAENGTETLRLITSLRPDLVVIDIKMPGIDGLEAMRRAGEAGVRSRYLILSGYSDFVFAQQAIRLGAKGYFLKPLKIGDFRDELTRQFAEIEAERNAGETSADLDMLMRGSRVYFLNQLIRGEVRGETEIFRRAEALRLTLADAPFALVHVGAVCESREEADRAFVCAEHAFSALYAGQPCEC